MGGSFIIISQNSGSNSCHKVRKKVKKLYLDKYN